MASELEFGLQTREELDEAGLIMARAYEDYDYVTLYFPDMDKSRKGLQIFMQCVLKTCYGKADLLAAHRDGKQLALFTNSRENLAFYSKRGYEVFHECEIEHDGKKIGSWSMKKKTVM